MANNWNIPDEIEQKARERDKFCVYCHIELKEYPQSKGMFTDQATIEHMDNTGLDNNGLPSEENIAICCGSCNASRGTKNLLDWFESPYCKKKNINKKTVAEIIKQYIEHNRIK